MRRWLLSGLAAVTLVAVAPFPSAGQAGETADDWRPGTGDRSLAFSVPEAGAGAMALWWYRARGRAFGLELEVEGEASLLTGGEDPDQAGTDVRLAFGPAFKRYRGSLGPVASYFLAGFGVLGSLEYTAVDDPALDPATEWDVGAYVRIGGGVDWFVAERVSLGGHVGGRLEYTYRPGPDTPDADRHALQLGTFTSGLTLHLYF